MYYSEPDHSWIFIISGLISFILFIILFAKIIQISKNVKSIKKESSTSFKLREKAILNIHNGNLKDALELINSAFVTDCMCCIEMNYSDFDSLKKEIWMIIYEYSRYKNVFPELDEKYFLNKSEELKSIYLKKQ